MAGRQCQKWHQATHTWSSHIIRAMPRYVRLIAKDNNVVKSEESPNRVNYNRYNYKILHYSDAQGIRTRGLLCYDDTTFEAYLHYTFSPCIIDQQAA